jgi:hypothetical protein
MVLMSFITVRFRYRGCSVLVGVDEGALAGLQMAQTKNALHFHEGRCG